MGLMVDDSALLDAVKSLRQEVARLSERLAALEKRSAAETLPPPPTRAFQSKPVTSESISEEIVMVISAAIAAYLGVKPHLRQIRLLNNNPWGLQGRVKIQASHALETYHG